MAKSDHIDGEKQPMFLSRLLRFGVLFLVFALLALPLPAYANHGALRVNPFNTNPINTSGQPGGSFATQLREALDHEIAQQGEEHDSPFVFSGGLHGTAGGLTSAAFATVAYVPERVNQTATAITYAAIANDVCWTIISSDTNGIAGWSRVGSTAYYYQCEGDTTPTEPTLPPNRAFLMMVQITASTITTVNDRRKRGSLDSGLHIVNVLRYGADSSGLTDSTTAFQNAANALYARASFQPGGVSTNISTQDVFVIPPGHYRINAPVTFTGTQLTIKGDGAIIEQTTAGQNSFVISAALMVHISGVRFASGAIQLHIYSANLDSGVWTVENCVFQNSSSWAIDTQSPSGANPFSTRFVIKDSRFIANARILRAWNDHTQVKDSWVFLRAGQTLSNTAAFENRGFLHFNGMFGVPPDKSVGPLTNVRWIDNYGSLIIRGSRFGGEFGGITPIWNYAHVEIPLPANGLGPRIIIEDSEVFDNTASQGIVTIKADTDGHPGVPGLLMMSGNLGPDSQPPIANPDGLDLASYIAAVTSPEQKFKFQVEPSFNRTSTSSVNVPLALVPYFRSREGREQITVTAIPTQGAWVPGQYVINTTQSIVGTPLGYVNVVAGAPGSWSSFGETNPFEVGAQAATQIAGDLGKVSFSIPDGMRSWVAILTFSTNPNQAGSGQYRTTVSYLIAYTTGFDAELRNFLGSTSLFSPGTTGLTPPTLSTLHFGTGDTGNNYRAYTAGGQFTAVFTNSQGTSYATLKILHLSQ